MQPLAPPGGAGTPATLPPRRASSLTCARIARCSSGAWVESGGSRIVYPACLSCQAYTSCSQPRMGRRLCDRGAVQERLAQGREERHKRWPARPAGQASGGLACLQPCRAAQGRPTSTRAENNQAWFTGMMASATALPTAVASTSGTSTGVHPEVSDTIRVVASSRRVLPASRAPAPTADQEGSETCERLGRRGHGQAVRWYVLLGQAMQQGLAAPACWPAAAGGKATLQKVTAGCASAPAGWHPCHPAPPARPGRGGAPPLRRLPSWG